MLTVQQKIDALKPGEQVVLTKTDAATCLAERSTCGTKIRFIREYPCSSWETIKTTQFA